MQVFVVEVNGRGVVALSADDRYAAELALGDDSLRDDLAVLHNGGEPIWDGTSDLFLRDPYPEEQAKFDTAMAREQTDECAPFLVFLVPVSDPTTTTELPDQKRCR